MYNAGNWLSSLSFPDLNVPSVIEYVPVFALVPAAKYNAYLFVPSVVTEPPEIFNACFLPVVAGRTIIACSPV